MLYYNFTYSVCLFLLGSLGSISVSLKKKSSAEVGARGGGEGAWAWAMDNCTITLLHTHRLSKTEFAVFVSVMRSLLPEDLHSELLYLHCKSIV